MGWVHQTQSKCRNPTELLRVKIPDHDRQLTPMIYHWIEAINGNVQEERTCNMPVQKGKCTRIATFIIQFYCMI